MSILPRRGWIDFEPRGMRREHWSEIGALDATDAEILAWAVEHEAVVLTCDLDLGAILAASQAHTPA